MQIYIFFLNKSANTFIFIYKLYILIFYIKMLAFLSKKKKKKKKYVMLVVSPCTLLEEPAGCRVVRFSEQSAELLDTNCT